MMHDDTNNFKMPTNRVFFCILFLTNTGLNIAIWNFSHPLRGKPTLTEQAREHKTKIARL